MRRPSRRPGDPRRSRHHPRPGPRRTRSTQVLQGERARAAAPPDVSSQLRLTAQAEADAHRQVRRRPSPARPYRRGQRQALAAQLATERQRLEADNARYEQWSAGTHATRDAAGKATAELQRRGHAQPDGEPSAQPEDQPQLTAGWSQPARGRRRGRESRRCQRAPGRQRRRGVPGRPSASRI